LVSCQPLSRAKANAFWLDVAAGVARGERLCWRQRMRQAPSWAPCKLFSLRSRISRIAPTIAKNAWSTGGRAGAARGALLAARRARRFRRRQDAVGARYRKQRRGRLYAKLGWQACGVIPGFALLPGGGLCDTKFFYRALEEPV